MPIPRISLAAIMACGALALFVGHSEYGPDVLVNDPGVAREYAAPAAGPDTPAPEFPASAVPAPISAAPIAGEAVPHPMIGIQRHFPPSPEQWENARMIVDVVRERGLPLYAAVIALATAIQESSLQNLTEAVDCDSLGLFQQRPSAGWGEPGQLTDPAYAAGAFLDALTVRVPDYAAVPLWQAAQGTQASAFPELYAQWEEQALDMVRTITG